MSKVLMFTMMILLYSCEGQDSKTDAMSDAEEEETSEEFSIESSSFSDGAALTSQFSDSRAPQCSGNNDFPHLSWSSPPEGTESFVLIVQDPDGSDWIHLNLYDIPATTLQIPELTAAGTPPTVSFPAGTVGTNSWTSSGWSGPCPPSGTHRYIFRLYALSIASLGAALNNQTFSDFETDYSANILDYIEISARVSSSL